MKNKYKQYQLQLKVLLIQGKYFVARNVKRYLGWEHSWKTTSVAVLLLVVAGFLCFNVLQTTALTSTLVADGDLSTGWPVTGGTSDGTCAGGTYCDYVDEGTTISDSDYVSTGQSGAGGEREAFSLSNQTAVASASQIVVTVRLKNAFIGGSSSDTVAFGLIINGVDQTATTVTPAATISNFTATFTGSWTQSDVDSMGVYMTRTVLGTGPGGSRDDEIQVSSVYATLTYVPALTVSQSAYRWFANQDTSAPATFVNAFGGSGIEHGYAMANTADGGYILAGETQSYGAGNSDSFIVKYDAMGNMSWSKTWGQSSYEYATGIIQTSDGGYAITGNTQSFGAGSADAFIAKYDGSGNLSWSSTWGGTGTDDGNAIIQNSAGEYLITGVTGSFGAGNNDAFIAKFSSTGSLVWDKTWGDVTSGEIGKSLIQTTGGNYIVASSGNGGAALLKYNDSGTLLWSKKWGASSNDVPDSIVKTSDGGFIVTGYTNSYGAGSDDMFVAKYDSSEALSWSKTWGGTASDKGNSIVQTTDGGYAVAGSTNSYGGGLGDALLVKFDSSGTVSWSKTWDNSANSDEAVAVVQTKDGGYAVSGSTFAGSYNAFLAKYDSSGNIAGCSSPNCQSPSVTAGTPSAATGTFSVSDLDPTATVTSPSPITTSPTSASGTLVALSPNTINVGSQLAARDTAATAPAEGTPFRLRLNLHISGSTVAANASQYKLRFALKGAAASCSTVTTGYNDVTDTSTIRYYDNTNAGSGIGLVTNAATDPVHGTDTTIPETYQEKGTTTFTNNNAISAGQDGMWDFALVAYHSLQNDHYCFKVTSSGNTDLDSYSVTPELIMPAATFGQAAYRWYNPEPSGTNATFAKAYGDAGSQSVTSAIKTSDGGYATVSNSTVTVQTGIITKYTASGTIVWSTDISTQDYSTNLTAITQTYDGGFVVTGNTIYSNTDILLAKVSSTGTFLWSASWGGTSADDGNAVCEDSAHNLIVAGQTDSYSSGATDAVILEFGEDGSFTTGTYMGTASNDVLNGCAATSDGGFVVTGYSPMGYGSDDVLVAKYNSLMSNTWIQKYGGANYDQGYAIRQTSDGGYIVVGKSNTATGNMSYAAIIVKLNSSGGLVWNKAWGTVSGGDEEFYDVVQTSDGGYAAVGSTTSYGVSGGGVGTTANDIVIAKYTSTGTLSWSKTWGGTSTDYGQSIAQTTDNGFIVGGYTLSYGAGSYDSLLLKYDSSATISGCNTTTMCMSVTPSLDASPSGMAASSATLTSADASAGDLGAPYNVTGNPTSLQTLTILGQPVPIGNPLAPLNQPLDMVALSPLHLRLAVAVDSSGIDVSASTFKLQYAVLSGQTSCSAVPTGNYNDVTTSSEIAFYDDNGYDNGGQISQDINDPSDGTRTMKAQTYQESNNFTNGVSQLFAGEDGIWQFSLVINNTTLRGKNFCLRAYSVTNTSMLTAANVADVAYAPQMTQLLRGGNWFNRQGIKQPILL